MAAHPLRPREVHLKESESETFICWTYEEIVMAGGADIESFTSELTIDCKIQINRTAKQVKVL